MSRVPVLTPDMWIGGIAPGIPRPVTADEIGPELHPRYWKCCRCAATMSCVESRDSFFHPSQTADRDLETCGSCFAPRCLFCIFLGEAGAPLMTVGGKQLDPDWSQPAGWRCCVCSTSHMPQQRGRLGTHVAVQLGPFGQGSTNAESDDDGDNDSNTTTSQAITGYLHPRCQHPGCARPLCAYCTVLSLRGAVLGTMGSDAFQPVARGPLYAHARWCLQYHRCVLAVVDDRAARIPEPDAVADSEGSGGAEEGTEAAVRALACMGRVAEAEGDVEELWGALGRIRLWAGELRTVVDALIRGTGPGNG
ncbi:hypothetical protein C8A05DRAFT_30692 [Staphylotrichum tortipilum]|uniref:Uncharacterized protein n=1 Tax=Staphylotrichum tortipilum TaxID=2831512 RepID=A0AAN6RWL9_9PEZI|nr:hypothetical protein C8A05DRAFT_30692 [Staphylotrichum longicolle]